MTTPDYDTDFYAWAQAQAAALRAKDWAALDIDHLAEEVDDLGTSVRKGIVSQLERLLVHLLKWRYDPATDPRRLWRLSILDARHELSKDLATNRTLRGFPSERLADAYRYARRVAAVEMDLPSVTFPEACEWTVDQVLDEDFLLGDAPHDQPVQGRHGGTTHHDIDETCELCLPHQALAFDLRRGLYADGVRHSIPCRSSPQEVRHLEGHGLITPSPPAAHTSHSLSARR